jgi:membrane associated rhomboid family serine protease
MGIHDREYIRSSGRSGARRAPTRPFTVTGWLIALCSAVFVASAFLPLVAVPMRTQLLPGVVPADLAKFKASEFKSSPIEWTRTRGGEQTGRSIIYLGTVPKAEREYVLQPILTAWGYFSTATALPHEDPLTGWGGLQVWRFVTFQFLHANLNHLIFNMLTLYFFGGMVEQYLGRKRYLAFYLLCGVCGALMYLLLNGLALGGQTLFGPRFEVPGLLFNDATLPLVGASAGVFGVIMAGAYLAPNAEVLLFFFLPMRLRTLAYGLLGFAVLAVWFGWSNAGGEAAHIGGALAGYYFIRNPHHLHGMFDFLGQFDPTSRVARARAAARRGGAGAEIDRILAKIREQGLHSLTEGEKQLLREASRR